jgi:hypothetical protein
LGAFKQKLGETIASRSMASQTNEILCLAIAYNLMILVRQMFEWGLLPDFLQSDPRPVGDGAHAPANGPLLATLGPGDTSVISLARPASGVAKLGLPEMV